MAGFVRAAAPLEPDQAELAARVFPVVSRMCAKVASRFHGIVADEIRSRAGWIAVEAASTCDTSIEDPLKFVRYRATRLLVSTIRGLTVGSPRATPESKARRAAVLAPRHFSALPTTPTRPADPPTAAVDAEDATRDLLRILPDRDARIVRRVVVEGATREQAAAEEGLSKTAVFNIIARSLAALREREANRP